MTDSPTSKKLVDPVIAGARAAVASYKAGAWSDKYAAHQLAGVVAELLERISDETNASPQAPIAKVRVANGKIVDGKLYSPGLPTGVHDLYCEPEATAPYLRENQRFGNGHRATLEKAIEWARKYGGDGDLSDLKELREWLGPWRNTKLPEKAVETTAKPYKPGFTQACSSFSDDPDAPSCCCYCGQPREAHPPQSSECPKCEAVRKLGLTSCFEHKQAENGDGSHA